MAASIAICLLSATLLLPLGQAAAYAESPTDLQIIETKWKSFFYRPGWDAEQPPTSWRRVQMYEYSIKVKNVGKKTIKAIDYGYLFINPKDESIVGAHAFRSRQKIGPGKQKRLIQESRTPPTRRVDAGAVAADGAVKPFREEIRVMRIYYTDGTVWRRKTR